MGVSAAKFDSAGQSTQHYIPGVYSRRNTIGSGSGVSSGNLCIIGTSTGGKPLTLHSVADIGEAKELLIGGNLLQGVAHAFDGSNTYTPQQLFCMRVNAGTQSEIELKNSGTTILRVKSADYGVHTNQLKLWIKTGTKKGKKVLASFRGNDIEIDNIAKESISIVYTGEGSTCTCTTNQTGLTLTCDTSEDSLNVTWEECPTLEELVTRINDTGKYSAVLLDTAVGALSSELDHVSSKSVHSSAATFNSDLQALIVALKSVSFLGEVTLESEQRLIPGDDSAFVYFKGGTAGTSTVEDYTAAISELEKYDIQIISTPTTDNQVHVLINNHCVLMSTVGKKKERSCWLGAAAGTSIDDGLNLARGYNSEFCSLVITAANANNPLTGASENINPAMLACKCAGMESALGVSNPLTNKMIKVNSFDKKYKDSELNKMIAGGIVPFGENDDGNLVCIRSMTTYQGDSLVLNERSMIRSVMYMDRDLRKAFSPRTGTNDEPAESTIIQTLVEKSKEWYAQSLITKSSKGDLFENAKVRFDGDKCYLTFERFIRAPNNFTFITATNKVYKSTIEV